MSQVKESGKSHRKYILFFDDLSIKTDIQKELSINDELKENQTITLTDTPFNTDIKCAIKKDGPHLRVSLMVDVFNDKKKVKTLMAVNTVAENLAEIYNKQLVKKIIDHTESMVTQYKQ